MCSWVSRSRLLTPNTAWQRRLGQETGPGRQALPLGQRGALTLPDPQASRRDGAVCTQAVVPWPYGPPLIPSPPRAWFLIALNSGSGVSVAFTGEQLMEWG